MQHPEVGQEPQLVVNDFYHDEHDVDVSYSLRKLTEVLRLEKG